MKLAVWYVMAALSGAGAACGGGSSPPPAIDAAVTQGAPTGFTFEAVGDRSFASFGWAGTIHNLRVPDGTPFGVKTVQCDGPNGICTFEGPTDPVSAVNRRRCLNRMSTTCTTDSQCPAEPAGARKCVYIYDPPTGTPIPGAPGKVGACGWSYIVPAPAGQPPTISGSLDLTSGELTIANLSLFLPLNGATGTYRGSCAQCVDDKKPNDGVKDGHCETNAQSDPTLDNGQRCDVNRFGNVPGFEGSYSMDCSPTVMTGDQPPNRFGGAFTSSGYKIEIGPSSPNCTAVGFEDQKCFCGMCPPRAGVAPRSCLTNTDCGGDVCGQLPANCNPNGRVLDDSFQMNGSADFDPSHLPNQCKTAGLEGVFATAPNSCVDGVCNWNAEDATGSCRSTLTGQMVGCYPSKSGAVISAPGGATKSGSVWIVNTATAFCTPSFPKEAAGNNAQLGLPGLTIQKRSFRIISELDK
ncbi:MAG: hypothetical protein H7138_23325 [Myxococcales bacterium]|nr:hypothetical protein [Myxococcales bacterium]